MNNVSEALKEEKFKDITPVFWKKHGHTQVSKQTSLIHTVECMVMARHGDIKKVQFDLSTNPRERENFMCFPPVTTYCKYENGDRVNTTQKPSALGKWFMDRYIRSNGHVLIVGAGSGGEVWAGMEAQLDVTFFEQDTMQYDFLVQSVIEHSTPAVEDEELVVVGGSETVHFEALCCGMDAIKGKMKSCALCLKTIHVKDGCSVGVGGPEGQVRCADSTTCEKNKALGQSEGIYVVYLVENDAMRAV